MYDYCVLFDLNCILMCLTTMAGSSDIKKTKF